MSSDRQTCEACFLVQPGDWRRVPLVRHSRKVGVVESRQPAVPSRPLDGGGIVELAGVRPSSRASANPIFGIRAEAQGLFLAVDAVLAAPELAAGRGDEQVQAVAIKELALLVGRLWRS